MPSGSSLWRIATDLERAGVVRSARAFVVLARWRGVASKVRAGEYALAPSWGAERVLEELVAGRVVTYEVVLPEGLTAAEIAARLEAATLVRADEFLAVARDPAVAREFERRGHRARGLSLPRDLSHAPRTQREAGRAGARRSVPRAVGAARGRRAGRVGSASTQVVTLASIVEKETGAPSERPLVASVFWNRLERGMRLESDPTTIYGIADFDGNLRREHLEDEANPWNTYQIVGLPPTPIANPGAASLAAVLRPAASEYLYFVAKGDGTHVFARSYGEHLDNVARYQRRPASR